ncbi:MAG TPA: hemerythrin domain-containing protein [Nocardioidaceae bacterium]|nr:hemerythrin domain-containing protein [Nocardioidaceae bacterium]
MITTAEELVQTLTEHHEQLKGLLPQVLEAEGERRAELFARVRRMLAAHEALEQETVHVAARTELGDEAAKPRLSEEHEAGEAIAGLEELDVDSDDFTDGFQKLSDDVVEHAESEEQQEFDKLSGELTEKGAKRAAAGLDLVSAAEDGSLEGSTFAEMFATSKETINQAG